jgi:hypothetical protein
MKKTRLVGIAICVLLIAPVFSGILGKYSFEVSSHPTQEPQIFIKAVGGNGFDYAESVTQPREGGPFAAVGPWDYNGVADALVAKFSSSGEFEWARGIGGTGYDGALSVVEASDGGFVMTGEICRGSHGDLLIAKFSSDGHLVWAEALGGPGWERGLSVIETHNGKFAVSGLTTSFGPDWDLLIAVFDPATKRFECVKRLGGGGNEIGSEIVETFDDFTKKYYLNVTGWTSSFGTMDILLAKFEEDCDLEWAYAFGGSENDVGESIFGGESTGQDLFVTGSTTDSSGAGDEDLFIAKFDPDGNLRWAKSLGGASVDRGRSITGARSHPLSSFNLVVTGSTQSFGAGDEDVLLAAFDLDGNFEWAHTFGGSANEGGFSVKQAVVEISGIEFSAGRLLVAGNTSSWGTGPESLFLATFDSYGFGAASNLPGFECSRMKPIQPAVKNIKSSLLRKDSLSAYDISPPVTSITQYYEITPTDTLVCTTPLVEYTDMGDINDPVLFSFAVIADNHHNIPNLDEVVNWINENENDEKIKFVIHVGDITDETKDAYGRKNCRSGPLMEAKDVLDTLEIPYIPLIGNHDVWYDYSNDNNNQPWFEGRPEEIFNQIFSPQYDYLGNLVLANWIKASTPVPGQPPSHAQEVDNYFQNFAFDYMRYHFICLDWVSRDDIYTSDEGDTNRGWPDLQDWATGGTWNWFTDHLANCQNMGNENVLLFAHHPWSFCYNGLISAMYPIAFKESDYGTLQGLLSGYRDNVDKWFAGHVHIPIEENITDNQGLILQTVVTASVSPWAPDPFDNPYAPALRIVRVHDDLWVDFNFNPENPVVNENISFAGSSGASSPSWYWDFGNGAQSGTKNPTLSYSEPGVYKVTLTVTDGSETASIAHIVDVGTKQHTSNVPTATAYNNSRKLMWDPKEKLLHLVYMSDQSPSVLVYAASSDKGITWFEVTPEHVGVPGLPALGVDESGNPYWVQNWGGIGSGFDAKRREKPLGWFSYDGVSDYYGGFGYPSVTVDSENNLHIAISHSRDKIRYYIASPNGLISDPEPIPVTGTGDCQLVSIALDNSGKPHVLWQQDGVIYHSKRDAVNNWTSARPISSSGAEACTPSLTLNKSSGELYAVWQEKTSPSAQVMFAGYSGTWSNPVIISEVSSDAESCPQVVSRDGITCVVWADLSGTKHDIFYSRKTNSSWSTPKNISNTIAVESKYPQAAITTNGNLYLCVVWTKGDSEPYKIQTCSYQLLGVWEEGVEIEEEMWGKEAEKEEEKEVGIPTAILIPAIIISLLIGIRLRKGNSHPEDKKRR